MFSELNFIRIMYILLLVSQVHLIEESNFWFFIYSNPSLRVAYIDEVEEREGGNVQKVYYSVLIKAVDNIDQVNAY